MLSFGKYYATHAEGALLEVILFAFNRSIQILELIQCSTRAKIVRSLQLKMLPFEIQIFTLRIGE